MAALLLLLLMLSIFSVSALPHSPNNLSHHHHQQQEVLLLGFKASVVKNGTLLPDWTPLHHFCNWTGVICHSSSHSVRAINLTQMSLHGTISPVLGNLSSLRFLDLSHNSLTGTIPPQLGHLPNLWILSLHDNQLQGTIPLALSACRSLYYLDLSWNQLHGSIPPELSLLTSLKNLYLGFNTLTGIIPPSLKNISALVKLFLAQNELHGPIPPELGMLTDLEVLSLFGNHLSGKVPESLGNCSRLKLLLLARNQFGGTLPMALGKLNLLTRLYINNNQLVSDSTSNTLAFLTDFTNCSHLQTLAMGDNHFIGVLPPSIGQLSSNLNLLALQGNMITGSIPQQIANLTNLTYLDLGQNLFSGNIPSIIKRLHELERLHLNGNKLEGRIPSEIGQMQHLGLLDLSHNQLAGSIPDSLCSSQQLRYLYLHHNNLSKNIPFSLEGCQKLELLDLSYNKLGGRIPREIIASLKNLQFYLNLSWNSLEGSLPQEMSKIVMAQAIDISGNRLTGVIPYSIGDCTALEQLNLSHNAFVGPLPVSLSKLKNLQEIDLSFNNLSGQIPEAGLFPNRTVVALFMGNPDLCGPKNYSLPPCANQTKGKHSLLIKIVLSVVGTIVLVSCCFIIGILWWHKLSSQLIRPSSSMFGRLSYQKFSYQDLVIATAGFDESNLLGVGNFGSVYKGILTDGDVIAIKTLNVQNEEALKSFKRECEFLRRIRHRNLIRVISAFYYPDFKGLVLKFAYNGSLEKQLHPVRDDEDFIKMGLRECLSIAVDVAHGIEYLHYDCPLQIVHCDLKPSNVLLDADMTAIVTDFGISRLTSVNPIDSLSTTTIALKGSIGYIAPEYGFGGNVSIEGDVYSFGILILEMVTRKRPSDDMFVRDMSLQKWVRSVFPKRLVEIVDSELLRDVNESMEDNKCLISFIHAGLLCSSESPRERPSMRDVVNVLESLNKSLMGGPDSKLRVSISELLDKIHPTENLASGSQSSTV